MMTQYHCYKSGISAQEAYNLAKKVSAIPNIQINGVSLVGNKDDLSLLYHAAKAFGLEITHADCDGTNIKITKRITKLKYKEWNEFINNRLNSSASRVSDNDNSTVTGNYGKISPSLKELTDLTGLANVKSQINDLADYMKVTSARKKAGLPATMMGQHLVFTGNPGTGKTTVARIVGEIYREFGLLRKGHFTEIGGRDLIAEYIGQTTEKVKGIVEGALDGVLFIDEAYALVSEGCKQDFGHEAVAALIKYMEDYRDRLVVIVAGYEKEMETLLNSNPGLKSRFKTKIDFTDYTKEELFEIFIYFCNKEKYVLSQEAKDALEKMCEEMDHHKGDNFGNGRTVRNAFEKTIMNQCRRLARLSQKPNKEDLQTFHFIDIPKLDDFDW